MGSKSQNLGKFLAIFLGSFIRGGGVLSDTGALGRVCLCLNAKPRILTKGCVACAEGGSDGCEGCWDRKDNTLGVYGSE